MQVSLCHSTVYKVFLQPTGRAYSAYFVSFLLQNSPCSITVIHIAVCLPPALIKALQKHTNVYVNCCEITLLQKLRTACREGRRGWDGCSYAGNARESPGGGAVQHPVS